MGKRCSAFGHSNFYANVHDVLRSIVSTLVKEQEVTVFMTGGMGDFDAMFCRTVREIKIQKREVQLILVKPYFSNELNTNREYYNTYFDDVVVPNELLGVHCKSVIRKRNRWMVDRSEFVIAGIYRDFGGAYQTIQYAKRSEKKVIDITKK